MFRSKGAGVTFPSHAWAVCLFSPLRGQPAPGAGAVPEPASASIVQHEVRDTCMRDTVAWEESQVGMCTGHRLALALVT